MQSARIGDGTFDFNDTGDNHFESLAKTNGTRYWHARDLMRALGYEHWTSFKNVINRAIGACMTLGISISENFIQETVVAESRTLEDFKLSRFACCLVALNGDPKKPNVAAAQVYFVSLAQVINDVSIPPDSADRVVMREEISDREITLSKAATAAGVEFYDRFQNAGYRGMYNMDYRSLKRLKGIPDMRRSLLDFMGKEELAGNLFRLTLTEGRIKKDLVKGQRALEDIAEQVGRRVRQTMIEETGVRPEALPTAPDIKTVRSGLKKTGKAFKQLDNVAQERINESEAMAELQASSRELVPGCQDCASGNRYSHWGSADCESGSIASGGTVSHCPCGHCSYLA